MGDHANNMDVLPEKNPSLGNGVLSEDIECDAVTRMVGREDNNNDDNQPVHSRVLDTTLMAAIFLGIGAYRSQEGATFLDLLLILDVRIDQGTLIQTAGNIGYMTGSLLSGLVVDLMEIRLYCFLTPFLTALSNIAVPFCNELPLMAAVMFVRNVFLGCQTAGVLFCCLKLWKDQSAIFIHLMFSLAAAGGVVAPFFIAPFLAMRIHGDLDAAVNATFLRDYEPSHQIHNVSVCENEIQNSSAAMMRNYIPRNCSQELETLLFPSVNRMSKTKVQWTFLIIGAYGIINSLLFLVRYIEEFRRKRKNSKSKKETIKKRSSGFNCHSLRPSSRIKVLMFIFVGLTFFSLGSIEKTFAIFLMPFVVNYLDWSKSRGTRILSAFWTGFAAGRLLGIPVSKLLSSGKILVVNIVLISIALITMYVGTTGHEIAMWACAVIMGLGMGSSYAALVSWTSEKVSPLSGKLTAFCATTFSLGIIIQLSLLGYLFDNYSPMWCLYLPVLFTVIIILCIIFLHVLLAVRNKPHLVES